MRISEKDMYRIASGLKSSGNGLIPACGYCRFSSDHQREESIEAQQRAITEYAERYGFEIVEWYIDRAVSGKTVNRPAFQKLLTDIEQKECPFKTVIVHKLDRFSRNAAQALEYKGILADYGICLVSTVEKIEDTANGKLLFGIMSTINQFYVDNLSTEVLKGMRENALKNLWNGGKPPLGYDVVDRKLVINEAEAVIVRKIFEMAADGCGYNTILRELNACGYLTKKGKPFGKNSLYDLIKNPRYKGEFVFNKTARRSSKCTRNSHKQKDESEIIRVAGGNPAIVSEELWERANVSRRMTAKISTNARFPYLLSGLIVCGECGAKFHGNHRKYGENGYNTYRCNREANQLVTCTCKEIRADILEEFVINTLTDHFFNADIIDIITTEINRKIQEASNSELEIVRMAKSSLNGLMTARSNLVDAIAQTGWNATLNERLGKIEQQITEYEAIIATEEEKREQVKVTREDVIRKIAVLKKCMQDPNHTEQTKLVLRSYIERIVVDNHSAKVSFKVSVPIQNNYRDIQAEYTHTTCIPRKTLTPCSKAS